MSNMKGFATQDGWKGRQCPMNQTQLITSIHMQLARIKTIFEQKADFKQHSSAASTLMVYYCKRLVDTGCDLRTCFHILTYGHLVSWSFTWWWEVVTVILMYALHSCWLHNIPATCNCMRISGTGLPWQLYMLPHWHRSCASKLLSHPLTVYWHWTLRAKLCTNFSPYMPWLYAPSISAISSHFRWPWFWLGVLRSEESKTCCFIFLPVTILSVARTWMAGSFESMQWNACVHRLDISLYSHPKEIFWNGDRSHVNSKGKIPPTRGPEEDQTWNATSRRTVSQTHYPTSYSGPKHVPICGTMYSPMSNPDAWKTTQNLGGV